MTRPTPRPDIEQFVLTLRRGKGRFVPNAEFGVHPTIKEKFLGHPLVSLADEVDFWYRAGYDYVKLQPVADFNPTGVGLAGRVTYNPDGTMSRKWASEGAGVIRSMEDLERYRFPTAEEFSYSRFEQVRSLLPDGLGVIGRGEGIAAQAVALIEARSR